MAISGFGVSKQSRTYMRKPVSGVYKGYRWTVECAQDGLFQWTAGKLSGWTTRDSNLEEALKDVRDAIGLLIDVEERYAGSNGEMISRLDQIARALRWAKQAAKGRLKMTMKRRKNGGIYYVVEETVD